MKTRDNGSSDRASLYTTVTDRIIAELEAGRLPWVQPWDRAKMAAGLPCNAGTGRAYSGINILVLWAAVIEQGYGTQAWLTYRQCETLGGHVRKGETGTTVCYADRFTPKAEQARAAGAGDDARQVAFLKRFTVFNVEQCEGLSARLVGTPTPLPEREIVPQAEALIDATGVDIRIGGDRAYYAPGADFIAVPFQQLYPHQNDWYRTIFHELGHWTGHGTRLDRDQSGRHGDAFYAREELVAEMASAFVCAALSIQPTVRHADYIGSWLAVLREESRAIFRAASQASKAADLLLSFRHVAEQPALVGGEHDRRRSRGHGNWRAGRRATGRTGAAASAGL